MKENQLLLERNLKDLSVRLSFVIEMYSMSVLGMEKSLTNA